MTKPIVQSITDEQLEDISAYANEPGLENKEAAQIDVGELRGLIARLRSAEKELAAVKDGANHRAIMSLRADCEALKKGLVGDYDLDAWLEFVRDEAQLRKDAERYRWLRQYTVKSLPVQGAMESLDREIDRARGPKP